MNKYYVLTFITLVLAGVFLGLSITNKEGAVHLVLIIPVISVNSLYSGLGALFIFLTFIFGIMGFTSGYQLVGWDEISGNNIRREQTVEPEAGSQTARKRRKVDIQGGGVVLLGPIPIVFGSNPKITLITVVITLVIMIIAFLFFFSMF